MALFAMAYHENYNLLCFRGSPLELLAVLRAPDHPLAQHPDSAAALEEMSSLFGFLSAMDALGPISFDLSLARGLDYYTGVIYEAVLEGGNVGSIAAGSGGREGGVARGGGGDGGGGLG